MSAWRKTPSEGGSGGKRGHSGMEHWVPTAEQKGDARAKRRKEDRLITSAEIVEFVLCDDGLGTVNFRPGVASGGDPK